MPGNGSRPSALWHPFADMGAIERSGELVITHGDGAHVYDGDGRRYFDSTASLWYANVGWGRTEIVDAVAEQMRRIPAYSNFGDTTTPPTIELAEKLGSIAPVPGSKVFFTSGGSDAVDTATKLARRYWQLLDQPDRRTVIVRRNAYHGMHVGGTSLAGIPANRAGLGPLLDDVVQVEWNSLESLQRAIDEARPEGAAAFFCEPVMGAGGVLPPPEGYLAQARAMCRDAGVLFVADEVITGFGRIGGTWFASTRFALDPDIVLGAKGLTSGYQPMGAVIVAPSVADPIWSSGEMWRHGYTYSGHAAAAAAGLANLAIIEREGLLDRAFELERELVHILGPLAAHDRVTEVRAGTGALAAIQLQDGLAPRVVTALRDRGVLSRSLADGSLQVSPPLVTTRSDLESYASAVTAALDDLP